MTSKELPPGVTLWKGLLAGVVLIAMVSWVLASIALYPKVAIPLLIFWFGWMLLRGFMNAQR